LSRGIDCPRGTAWSENGQMFVMNQTVNPELDVFELGRGESEEGELVLGLGYAAMDVFVDADEAH